MGIHSLKKVVATALAMPLLLTAGQSAIAQSAPSAQGKTELLWFGQAGFRIKRPKAR